MREQDDLQVEKKLFLLFFCLHFYEESREMRDGEASYRVVHTQDFIAIWRWVFNDVLLVKERGEYPLEVEYQSAEAGALEEEMERLCLGFLRSFSWL